MRDRRDFVEAVSTTAATAKVLVFMRGIFEGLSRFKAQMVHHDLPDGLEGPACSMIFLCLPFDDI